MEVAAAVRLKMEVVAELDFQLIEEAAAVVDQLLPSAEEEEVEANLRLVEEVAAEVQELQTYLRQEVGVVVAVRREEVMPVMPKKAEAEVEVEEVAQLLLIVAAEEEVEVVQK